MNGAANPVRSRNASFVTFLMLIWLLGLSIAAFLGYHFMLDQASREQVNSGLRQLQTLETHVTELAGTIQALQARPEAATRVALQNTRQATETRFAQLEQALAGRATAVELDAIRTELEQLKARPATVQPATPVQARPKAKPAVATHPRKEPFPFQVLGIERRAGQRALSIGPATGELKTDQIRVLLPGETLGRWRLETIDSHTAVFRTGQQTRRLAIPWVGHDMKAPTRLVFALLIAVPVMVSAQQPTISASQIAQSQFEQSRDERLARDWGLRTDEWTRYQNLLEGPLGIYSPHLDPLTALGIEARSDDARIREWARRAGIEPARVHDGAITLNHDAGRWRSLGLSGDLPAAVRQVDGQWQRQ
jgi:hypothetical protein